MKMHVRSLSTQLMAVTCSILLMNSSATTVRAQPGQQGAPNQDVPTIPNDQLDSLVSPIALYPDPLLAQILAASTYPLEIIQIQQWLSRNQGLKDQALVDAVQKEEWDPSIQALAPLPDVVKRLADDIKWTTDLGNAFLAQQADVMDAVQRMRKKAYDAGNLKSSQEQKVETQVVETKTVVVIQQANPQVVYVPVYNPVVVYGPPIYPYPPIYYPPPSYYATGVVVAFGVGVAMGAAWGGGWGYGCAWGRRTVNINVNNTYIRQNNVRINNANINNVNRNINNVNRNNLNASGNNTWQHNPQHRGGAPYSNRATANQYGGSARGDSMASRQATARQNQSQLGGRQQVSNRPSQGQGQLGARQQPGVNNRAAGGAGGVAGNGVAGAGSNMGANRPAGGGSNIGGSRAGSGGDRVGNRNVSPSPSVGSKGSAFGDSWGGASGKSARASSLRGESSMGAARGGGGGRRK